MVPRDMARDWSRNHETEVAVGASSLQQVAHIKDFEMDEALSTLDAASKLYPEGSKEETTIQLAAISLLYVRRIRKLDDFLEYYQEFFDPSFKVQVSHAFATQKDADEWLSSGKATDGELVSIAGQGFQVIQLPRGLSFLRTPLPAVGDSETMLWREARSGPQHSDDPTRRGPCGSQDSRSEELRPGSSDVGAMSHVERTLRGD